MGVGLAILLICIRPDGIGIPMFENLVIEKAEISFPTILKSIFVRQTTVPEQMQIARCKDNTGFILGQWLIPTHQHFVSLSWRNWWFPCGFMVDGFLPLIRIDVGSNLVCIGDFDVNGWRFSEIDEIYKELNRLSNEQGRKDRVEIYAGSKFDFGNFVLGIRRRLCIHHSSIIECDRTIKQPPAISIGAINANLGDVCLYAREDGQPNGSKGDENVRNSKNSLPSGIWLFLAALICFASGVLVIAAWDFPQKITTRIFFILLGLVLIGLSCHFMYWYLIQ